MSSIFIGVGRNHLQRYPSPSNLSYNWNFGSLSGLILVFQIITGLIISVYYVATADLAFDSVEHLSREINFGWLIHYLHSNGASLFFLILYIHILRGVYYRSSSLLNVWLTGAIIFILFMAVAFTGYVLPWGQMSLWGATVITNLFSIFPLIGTNLVLLLWGSYSVASPTIGRFYSLHFILPFFSIVVIVIHMYLLHFVGSSSSLKGLVRGDYVSFTSYFNIKDLVGLLVCLLLLFIVVVYTPNVFGHPDNYIPANSLITPPHIVPEWYFLPFYAILRSIPNKIFGVLLMFGSIFSLFLLPLLNFVFRSNSNLALAQNNTIFSPVHKILYWFLVVDLVLLGWLGGQPVTEPYISIGLSLTILFFFIFLFPLEIFIFFFIKKKSFLNFKKKKIMPQLDLNLFFPLAWYLSTMYLIAFTTIYIYYFLPLINRDKLYIYYRFYIYILINNRLNSLRNSTKE